MCTYIYIYIYYVRLPLAFPGRERTVAVESSTLKQTSAELV